MGTSIASVEVDPDGAEGFIVRWGFEGDPIQVDVGVGTTADHLVHTHTATVAPGEPSCRVARLPGGRQFVSVGPHSGEGVVVAAERRIPFEGITNFRDLGGYRTRSGRWVRWGQVFRSDALHGMSESDRALYDELGLRTVYDLRREVECAERPNPMPSRNLPILSRPAGDDTAVTFNGTTGEDGERILLDIYLGHIEHAAAQFGDLFSALADPVALPAVFHCHAGKDRTGLAAALLLAALGVERKAILDDYELTTRYWQRAQREETLERMINNGLPPEAAAGVLTAPRWVMESTLEYLDREYEDVAGYLTGPAAMSPADLRRLSDLLLTS